MKRYLGDGLYVELTEGMIRFFAFREDGDHEVLLEPATLNNFLQWLKDAGLRPWISVDMASETVSPTISAPSSTSPLDKPA